jgi:hypothetical protein
MKENALIFLSYSRKDKEKAHKLSEHLKKLDRQVWMDSEYIRAGQLWRRQIIDGIEKCQIHVILLTKNSIFSDNVRRELDLARTKKKPILPISDELDASQLSKEMEYQLIGLQQINYSEFIECNSPEVILDELTKTHETRIMHSIDLSSIPKLEHEDGKQIYLRKKEIRVGRGPDVDLDLTPWDRYRFVSRKHAVIFCDDGEWMIRGEDKARNPTIVNDDRVNCGPGVQLKNGAKVTFADIQFKFHQIE